MLNKSGDNKIPCLVPVETLNGRLLCTFHLITAVMLQYHLYKKRIICVYNMCI